MSARFVNKPNGKLQAVKRGSPPEPPDGYKQSKTDPYLFEPILSDCEFREYRERPNSECGCKKGTLFMYCLDKNRWVIPQECLKICDKGGAYEDV